MREDGQEQETRGKKIALDGTYGAGENAELKIVTKVGDDGRKEVSFIVPYSVLAKEKLIALLDFNLIKGFSIEKQEIDATDPQLKGLGL